MYKSGLPFSKLITSRDRVELESPDHFISGPGNLTLPGNKILASSLT